MQLLLLPPLISYNKNNQSTDITSLIYVNILIIAGKTLLISPNIGIK